MPPQPFLKLNDVVLSPPLPALLSLLIVAGLAHLGWRMASWLRSSKAPAALDVAAGFVLVAALVAALVQALATMQLSTVHILRPLGWALALVGAYGLLYHRRSIAAMARSAVAALAQTTPLERVAALLVTLTVSTLGLAALGPPTDADSFEYHLGVPLDWLRHGGAYPRYDWFAVRHIGIAECLNMLGLASGTDNLGAVLQWGGLLVAGVAVSTLGSSTRDRLLGWLLVASPVMLFLVPNQKPQVLPAAALTVAAILVARAAASTTAPHRRDAIIAFGCAAFAAASKTSLIATAGVVTLGGLWAGWKHRRLAASARDAALAFTVLLVPVLVRKFMFFGDPLSPFLEGLKAHPDPAILNFVQFLRVVAGEHTLANMLRLPFKLIATVRPGDLSTVLGVGALAFVPALRTRGPARVLLVLGLISAVIWLLIGQLGARWLLEPYLWAGAALVLAPWGRGKRLLYCALGAQSTLAAAMGAFAAATLFPGALTEARREAVMTRNAAGYAEARWLDRVLPADAVIITPQRFHAPSPRPFVALDSILFDPSAMADDRRVIALMAATGANTLVQVGEPDEAFTRLARRCGKLAVPPQRFRFATRNPFNASEYEARVYRLSNCDRDPR